MNKLSVPLSTVAPYSPRMLGIRQMVSKLKQLAIHADVAENIGRLLEYSPDKQIDEIDALRMRGVGKVTMAKLFGLNLIRDSSPRHQKMALQRGLEEIPKLMIEINKVKRWKAAIIEIADAKIARLEKQIASFPKTEN